MGQAHGDDFDVIAGKRDRRLGKLQESYGITKDEAERRISDWEQRQRDIA